MIMKRFYIILVLANIFTHSLWAGTAGKVRSGNSHYKKGEYEKSLEKYREAEMSAPNNAAVHFNIGDAQYQMGSVDESANEFRKVTGARDKRLQSMAYYNLGNAAYKKGNTDEAIQNYRKALILNPSDIDAKYNIEYLMQRKNEKKNKKNDDKKDKNNKDDKKQDGKGGQYRQQNAGQKQNKSGMSKEDAERLLNVFDESDRNSAKKRKMAMPQLPKVDEDW